MTFNHRTSRSPLCRAATSLVLVAFCTTATMLPPGAVRAAGTDDPKAAARVEVKKAQLDYKLGRFEEALAAYTRAYETFNAPALLFNIGQCHKNLKNYERAIFFFEGYLREETTVDNQKRTLAEELITESRAGLERQRAAAAEDAEAKRAAAANQTPQNPPTPPRAPTASSVASVFGTPPPPPSADPPLVDTAPRPDDGATAKPLTRKWWFWTALGVGALAIAGGAFAYYASAPTTTVPSGTTTLGTLDRR